MIKFEYWDVRFLPTVEDWIPFLNKLGAVGWELVDVMHTGGHTGGPRLCTFKRQIPAVKNVSLEVIENYINGETVPCANTDCKRMIEFSDNNRFCRLCSNQAKINARMCTGDHLREVVNGKCLSCGKS